MIKKAKEGLEDILRHNNSMKRTWERRKDLQRQEEVWRKDEKLEKHKKRQKKLINKLKWTLV